MKRQSGTLVLSVACAFLLISTAFAGDDAQQLMQSNGCTGCHARSSKVVGPAWGWIAYRYKNKRNAAKSVAEFIINGGTGYWKPWTGGIPMPSHHNLGKAQAEAMARWILAQPALKAPKP